MASPYPEINSWYQTADGETLCVIAIDEEERNIEVQYFEGEIEEYDLDTWRDLDTEEAAPPEDWSGTFDDLEHDQIGDPDKVIHPEDWDGPLSRIEGQD